MLNINNEFTTIRIYDDTCRICSDDIQLLSICRKIEHSGDSTKMWGKKSYDVVIDDDFMYSRNRSFTTNMFSLKAAFIDPTYVRNLVAADLWQQCLRTFYNMSVNAFKPKSIMGHLVDFWLNDEYQGVYEFCIHPCANIWTPEKHDRIFIEKHANLTNLNLDMISIFHKSLSKSNSKVIDNYNTTISDKSKLFMLPMYFTFIEYIFGVDNYVNNIQIINHQDKLIFCPFDLESTFGLHWRGEKFYEYDKSLIGFKHQSDLWEKTFHKSHYATYYQKLKHILNATNVMYTFTKYLQQNVDFDKDKTLYNYPMESTIKESLKQIEDFCNQRDEFMEKTYQL